MPVHTLHSCGGPERDTNMAKTSFTSVGS
jgi:hypothetical protein